MKKKQPVNMLICQSGGPTAVINQSLVGAALEARKHSCIDKVYGALHGIKGLLGSDLIDLGAESEKALEAVANTPSSALGTVRKKPTKQDCLDIVTVFERFNIRYFFYIGGNDSAETAQIIQEDVEMRGLDIHCFHIPKTIDNDLRENDHTPGFGSAAKFVASAVMGDNLDNIALPGVKIDVIMGRHAGFLAAATALARVHKDDGPHLIYLPESAFSVPQFIRDVEGIHKKLGRCLVVVSEGISDARGVPIATKFTKESDSHGNIQLSGSGALGDMLADVIKTRTSISRVRADTFGYLQRSFPGLVSARDASEARAVGVEAVRKAVKGTTSGSIVIRRKPGTKYQVYFECVPLSMVARTTKSMAPRYINKQGNDVTQAFIDYAAPIVGPLPRIGRLKYKPAGKQEPALRPACG